MQTVNFNCPHCGNLMAVGTNLLGRNVRCPHCKQVVRAPAGPGEAPAPPAAPPMTPPPPPQAPLPSFNVPKPTEHHESIFGERHDEDVFGSEPPKPTFASNPPVSLPPTLEETHFTPPPPLPAPQPNANADTLTYESPAPGFAPPIEERPTPPGNEVREEDRGYRPRPARESAPATPAFVWIILIYAALMTIAAGFFGFQYFTSDSNKGDHPFRAMPDVIREFDPAKKRQVSFKGMPDPKLEVPADLRVKLDGELTVGDLKVVPTSIEKQKIECTTQYVDKPDLSRGVGQSLVLTLRVKNVSTDTVFIPNDPAFIRAPHEKQPAPYTGLQIKRDFFYGPFGWPPDASVTREFVVGQEADDKPLAPGEERDTWVTAAPWGIRTASVDVLRTVNDLIEKKSTENLLWRVQLRRGIIKAKKAGGEEIDVSATTVIGVEFRVDQIGRQ
jgi:phage FluMu protein Com